MLKIIINDNYEKILNTLATRSRETRLLLLDAVGPRAVKRGLLTLLFCRAVFLSKRNENSRFFYFFIKETFFFHSLVLHVYINTLVAFV